MIFPYQRFAVKSVLENLRVPGLVGTHGALSNPCLRINGCLDCWAQFVDAPGRAVELTGAWTAGHNLWTPQAVL